MVFENGHTNKTKKTMQSKHFDSSTSQNNLKQGSRNCWMLFQGNAAFGSELIDLYKVVQHYKDFVNF